MQISPLLDQLIEALQRSLPGVGPKTAQRIAFRLLERDRQQGKLLAQLIDQSMHCIGHCRRCRIWSEQELCPLCANTKRDPSLLCVIETPADVLAIEQTHQYHGYYFVLMGHISPLDGVGPDQLQIDQLVQRLKEDSAIQEVILAVSHTIEGEATAHYIAQYIRFLPVKISRIVHGIPSYGELENMDVRTLSEALTSRTLYSEVR